MIDRSRRQALSLATAGLLVSSIPTTAWSALSNKRLQTSTKQHAYSGSAMLPNVDFVVSTLGVNSAVTTITNNSNVVVTVTALSPAIVDHNNARYDINASIGTKGITLKPGQKRIIVAQQLSNQSLKFA